MGIRNQAVVRAALCLAWLFGRNSTIRAEDDVLATQPASAATQPVELPSNASAPAAGYKPMPGPWAVELMGEFLLDDPKRGRPVPLRIRFPRASAARPGPFPIVIFSHGAGGSGDAFAELSERWASHGYVVVHPTHSDSIKLRRQRGERIDNLREELSQITRRVDLFDRRADVVLILDSLDEIERAIESTDAAEDGRAPDVRLLDRDRIAIAGHSAGALTAQTMAGVRFYGRGRGGAGRSFADPRIRAAVVISGQGLTRPAFREDSWRDITIPMLVIAGSRDVTAVSNETPQSRRHPFEYASPGDKYLAYIDGATHGSYVGKRTAGAIDEDPPDNIDYITDMVGFTTLAFVDAYLRKESTARAWLNSDAPSRLAGGRTEFRSK